MKNSIINKLLPLLILTACGGGGGGGSSYGGGDDGYNPNNPPVIDGSTTSYSVIENQISAFTVSATDADGDSLTYSVSGGDDGALFNISSVGVVTFIAAPDFEKEAITILQTKKNLRVLKVKKFKTQTEQRSIFAGALIQDSNSKTSQIKSIYGKSKLNKGKLNFFVNILKYIKSNAIALFDNDSLVSQSGGQTSRVDALQNCFYKLKLKHDYKKFKKLSLFSDAFFPFTDSLEFIKKEKMKVSIFAPMGSQNDRKIESFAKKNKLDFFKLSDRHFKH